MLPILINMYITDAISIPYIVLFLTFLSGFFISPAVTVALSKPTKAHKVEVAASGIVVRPFPSGNNGSKFIFSKFKNEATINNAKNPILKTVAKV